MPPVKDPYEDKLSRARNPGDEHYADEFKRFEHPSNPSRDIIDKPTHRDTDPGEEALEDYQKQETNPDDPRTRSEDDVDTQENRGDSSWKTNVEPTPDKGGRSPLQALRKKRNAVMLTMTMMAATAGLLVFIAAPAYFLVHIKEVLVKKFGDRMQSLQQVRVNRIVAKQLSGNPLTSGCGTVKVKCRYKGMTDRQIKKMKARNPGIQIRTEGKNALGRNKIGSIGFTDDNGRFRYITARDFTKAARQSVAFKKIIINYNKSKVAMYRDKQAGKVYTKLKIGLNKVRAPRGPPQTEDEIKKEKEERRDKKLARRAAVATKYSGTIKTSNIISTLCAIKGLFVIAKEHVKIKMALEMAQFAMDIGVKPGDTIKSGLADGNAEVSNAISRAAYKLNATDEKGNTFSDSFGYQYASEGILTKDRGNQRDYQLGLNSEKGFMGKISSESQGVPGLSEVGAAVGKVLNPVVCASAGIISVAFCLATIGVGCVVSTVGMVALVNIAMQLIQNDLIKTPDIKDSVGGNSGDAITGGFSYVSKQNNQYRGGYPLEKEQAIRYDTFSDNAQGGGNWQDVRAYDIHNPDSFAGKLASAFLPPMARVSASASSIPTTLASLPGIGLSRLSTTTQARSVIAGEYDQCDDAEYKSMNLATDPYCVPQYGFNPSLMLGDSEYNKPTAALDDEKPKKSGFSLAWLFEDSTAKAAVDNRGGFIPDNRYDADLVVDFMHDGDKPWIDDDGTGVAYDDSDDDYIDYSEKCLETTEPIGPNSPDMCKPKKCTDASNGSDEFRYCMYSVYAGDSSIDDQLEDRDASGGNGDADAEAEDASSSSSGEAGEVKTLAQELLDNSNVTYPYTDTRGLNVREVLQEVAKTGKGIVNSPDVSFDRVEVSPDMLQAIADYAKNNKIGLNALTNADHSSTSNHYKGIAVDFACTPSLNRSEFDKIAAKYGGKNNGEVCPGDAHWHYDFPKGGAN